MNGDDRLRALGRSGALLLTTVFIAVVTLFAGPATPAVACSITNPIDCATGGSTNPTDCLDPPTPAMPDTGATSFFVSDPGPQAADGKLRRVWTYDQFGYAGLQYHTYDLGCGPDGAVAPDALINASIANMIFGVATFLIGLANSVREYAYDPGSMWGWTDDLVASASDALYHRVFTVLGLVAVVIVGVWLMWSARRGELSSAAATAGWAILVMVITTAVAAWPLRAATIADNVLTSSLGVINTALHPNSQRNCGATNCVEDRSPQRRASSVVTDVVLYRQWLSGTLGSPDSATAKAYGYQLYSSSALTWDEAREVRKFPSRRAEIIKLKEDKWKETAAKIKSSDPDAYEYLTGKQGSARIGSAFTALVAAVAVVPFDIMASLLIIVAFLIIRLAVVFLPAIAVVGILRPASAPLRALFRTVVAAIVNCVLFGVGASVYLLAVELITGTRSLAGWQQILLIWLTGLVMWLALRPFRRLTSLTNKDPFGELAGGLGRMHRKVFGDMKQLAMATAGTYLGDAAALEAEDKRKGRDARKAEGRPESWSRDEPRYLRTTEGAPAMTTPPPRPRKPESDPPQRIRGTGQGDKQAAAPAYGSTYRGPTSSEPDPLDDRSVVRADDPGALPIETGDTYVIYRPDRGYERVDAAPTRGDSSARVSQAATNVAHAAQAVRDLAAATGANQRRAERDAT